MHKRLKIKQTSITMLSANGVKVATTYFPTQPDDIRMNEVGTEPTPPRIIKFHKYLHKCTINVPTNRKALVLLGTILADAD